VTVTEPGWLVDVSQRSREELSALTPSNQPSWYRWVGGPDSGNRESQRAIGFQPAKATDDGGE